MLFVNFNLFKCLLIYFLILQSVKCEEDVQSVDEGDGSDVSYTFNGFTSVESVPIIFPKDICIMDVEDEKYAAALHKTEEGKQRFVVFKGTLNSSYEQIFEHAMPLAIDMDCKSDGSRGFIAIAFNFTKQVDEAAEGSPMLEIWNGRVRPVQYFTAPNMKSFQFMAHGSDIFVLQAFYNTETNPNIYCPYFKWTGYSFNVLGKIPCSNAKRIVQFIIGTELYIAVANYADQYGSTVTYSQIFKYESERMSFVLFQTIRTSGAIDVKFFSIALKNVNVGRQYFLVFANSVNATDKNFEENSIIYKFDKDAFLPYQELQLYAVIQFLPMQCGDGKFILLVACANQEMKIYELNDWKFQEAGAQYTEGALGKGVTSLRAYSSDADLYLVIANENMLKNETNIFLPMFKEESEARILRQEMMKWGDRVMKEFAKLNLDKLKADIEKVVRDMSKRTMPEGTTKMDYANVGTAYTNQLIIPKANFTKSYWRAIAYAQQAIEGLEASLNHMATNMSLTNQKESRVAVDTLVVKTNLTVAKVNHQERNALKFNKITASNVVTPSDWVYPEKKERANEEVVPFTFDSMNIGNLNISGTVNQVDYDMIYRNALRKEGDQVVERKFNVRKLKAGNVFTGPFVNGLNISNLVLIDGEDAVVNQDIQFSEPIFAKKVIVNERINNIRVVKGRLDVLLTQSSEPQVIRAVKNFENVKLMEPVTVGGKIHGTHLEKMIPIKPIHQDITVTGNYTITGNVIIRKQLQADNILGNDEENMYEILSNGLKLSQNVENKQLNFLQPIECEQADIQSINGLRTDNLVKTNSDEIQVITGHKVFLGDLRFENGYCDASEVNGVDLEELEKRIFSKSADQTVPGKLKFRSVAADTVKADEVLVGDSDIGKILTYKTEQSFPGYVAVDQLAADHVHADNFVTSKKVFGTRLEQLLTRHSHPLEIFNGDSKFLGNITVRDLYVDGTINGKAVHDIEYRMRQLEGSFKFVGAIDFEKDMKIRNLSFDGKFNGIGAAEFGGSWLRSGAEQTFTSPQILSSASFQKGIQLQGLLNNIDLKDLQTKTYRTDRPEFVKNIIFENLIANHSLSLDGSLNGKNVAKDFLLKYSKTPQTIQGKLVCRKGMEVTGAIKDITTLNGVNIEALKNYLKSNFSSIAVKSGAFADYPSFATLNGFNLTDLVDNVWLRNEDVVMKYHVELTDAVFEQEVDFAGPLNGRDLLHFNESYFSLSRMQEVKSQLRFLGNVTFEDAFLGKDLHLYGSVADFNGSISIPNFKEFVEDTIIIGTNRKITGNWSIDEIQIEGNLTNANINNLNLLTDVVRHDVPLNNITAPKQIAAGSIKQLIITNYSTRINSVKMLNWVHKSVLLHGNFTIQGTTTIDSLSSYGNVKVMQTVNQRPFNDKSILLRDQDQVIRGNVRIITKDGANQKIYPNTIENLNVHVLNGLNITEFWDNLVEIGRNFSVNGSLEFAGSVETDALNGNGFLYGLDTKAYFENLTSLSFGSSFEQDLEALQRIAQRIASNEGDSNMFLSHFEHIQTIPLKSPRKTVGFSVRSEKGVVEDWLVVLAGDTLEFLLWNGDLGFFERSGAPKWLDMDFSGVVDVEKVVGDDLKYLVNKNGSLVVSDLLEAKTLNVSMKGIENYFEGRTAAFDWGNGLCVVAYSTRMSLFCLKAVGGGAELRFEADLPFDKAEQILPLNDNHLAISLEKSVTIFDVSQNDSIQSLSILKPSKLTSATFNNSTYLAVSSQPQPKYSHYGSVEIFASSNDGKFVQQNTLPNIDAIQLEFVVIRETQELLLVALTRSAEKLLVVYRYNGVSGFKEIVGTSTIEEGIAFSLVHLEGSGKYLIVVSTKDAVEVVEIVLREY